MWPSCNGAVIIWSTTDRTAFSVEDTVCFGSNGMVVSDQAPLSTTWGFDNVESAENRDGRALYRSVTGFYEAFSGVYTEASTSNLSATSLAVVETAWISSESGQATLICAHKDEKDLVAFCQEYRLPYVVCEERFANDTPPWIGF